MTALGIVAKACGIALLMGALLGAYAWSSMEEPHRSRILRQAQWLIIPGYIGFGIWLVIVSIGIVAWGCDPVFGGFHRAPGRVDVGISELPACSETLIQARVRPELAAQYPTLPTDWSHVYLHYDDAAGVTPDTSVVYMYPLKSYVVLRVLKDRLEFRTVPPKRGFPWWRPQEASESW